MRLFSSFTIGLLLVIVGILFIFKNTLNINIPITRIVFGVLIILFGVNVLLGGSFARGDKDLIFSSGTLTFEQNKHDYTVIFGSGVIDLSSATSESFSKPIEVSTIFGSTVVKVNPDIPIIIKTNTAFGTTKTPDNEINFFGDSNYKNGGTSSEIPALNIETNTVFGETRIILGK